MKRAARILCLLLVLLLLVGCAPSGGNNDSTAAPEQSGAELTDKAVRTFVEMTALMQEAITPADREKLSETIKQFVGVSDEETK